MDILSKEELNTLLEPTGQISEYCADSEMTANVVDTRSFASDSKSYVSRGVRKIDEARDLSHTGFERNFNISRYRTSNVAELDIGNPLQFAKNIHVLEKLHKKVLQVVNLELCELLNKPVELVSCMLSEQSEDFDAYVLCNVEVRESIKENKNKLVMERSREVLSLCADSWFLSQIISMLLLDETKGYKNSQQASFSAIELELGQVFFETFVHALARLNTGFSFEIMRKNDRVTAQNLAASGCSAKFFAFKARLKIDECEGDVRFCYPLELAQKILENELFFQARHKAGYHNEAIKNNLDSISVDLEGFINASLSIRELLELEKGDILRLDAKDKASVEINKKQKFLGDLVSHEGCIAIVLAEEIN